MWDCMSACTEPGVKTTYEWQELTAANAPCPRSSHELSCHGSRVFLFGGEGGPKESHFGYGQPVDSTLYCLDLDKDAYSWQRIASETAPSPRLGHGQAILQHDDESSWLYVFGGRQPEQHDAVYDGSETISSLNDLYRICITGADGLSKGWERVAQTGDVPSVRSYMSLVASGTDLYLFGGMINDDRYSDLYRFTPGNSTWQRLPDGPMEGRGGAGVFVDSDPESPGRGLWVVGGHCGRPVDDVWHCQVAGDSNWTKRSEFTLPAPRSIYAGPVSGSNTSFPFIMFGGELAAATKSANELVAEERSASEEEEAGMYSNETLILRMDSHGEGADGVEVLAPTGATPAARGWTSACVVLYKDRYCFAVFGGIREGQSADSEPSGVRLGDFHLLVPNLV